MNIYDVAVIGAGPAGSRAAGKLSGLGHDVVVLEKKEKLDAPVCCTGIIGQECVELFGFENRVIYRQASAATVFSPSGKNLRVWRQKPQAGIVNRPLLNLALAENAMSAGAEYRLNTKAIDIETLPDRVLVSLQSADRNIEIVETRSVIVAEGFGSKLAGKLTGCGMGDFVMGVQAEVEPAALDEVEVYFGNKTAPGFFAWLVPTLPGRALAGLMSRKNPGEYLRRFLFYLAEKKKICSPDVKLRYGGVPLEPPKRTIGERGLVIGGAAGQTKPLTGGGVYFGLVCADIAADCLHRALESDTLYY
jgi:geranylgeranyl reductase family protein